MLDVVDIKPKDSTISDVEYSTIEGHGSFKKGLIMALPNSKYTHGDLIFNNLTDDEKEQLFNALDSELHDESEISVALQNRAEIADIEVEKLKEENEWLRENSQRLRTRTVW